ncbi:hypothetical protein ACEQ8H_002906 [Pleosporales sp. CAS-2024a]
MLFETSFVVLLAASGAVAVSNCGTSDPSTEQIQLSSKIQTEFGTGRDKSNFALGDSDIKINLYMHVVATDEKEAGGYLSAKDLDRQHEVLNNAFKRSNISFDLVGKDWTVQQAWARNCDELEMKRELRRGTYADLNLYFFPEIHCKNGTYYGSNSMLGYTSDFPWAVQPGSASEILDGVQIRADTLPGGKMKKYNKGLTAVHEVGHWLGLFHTFSGGCSGEGDGIDDTPAEDLKLRLQYISGDPMDCRVRDTCPLKSGGDPVDNYMTYSWDECYKKFTAGQAERMHSLWRAFRAKHQN